MTIPSHRLVVLKIGGSVLQTTPDFSALSLIIAQYLHHYDKVAIVVSALKGSTDSLIAQAHELSSHPAKRELDMLVSVGERISASLLCIALNEIGIAAKSFTGSQAGILTCDEHTQARIVQITPSRLHEAFTQSRVVVVAGFQGVSFNKKEITTLGRGGSDTSAVALGLALHASRVVFFKDVGTLYDSDPNVNNTAQKLDYCSYRKAQELMNVPKFILHPRAIHLADINNLPLHITSLQDPLGTATLIAPSPDYKDRIDFTQSSIFENV